MSFTKRFKTYFISVLQFSWWSDNSKTFNTHLKLKIIIKTVDFRIRIYIDLLKRVYKNSWRMVFKIFSWSLGNYMSNIIYNFQNFLSDITNFIKKSFIKFLFYSHFYLFYKVITLLYVLYFEIASRDILFLIYLTFWFIYILFKYPNRYFI